MLRQALVLLTSLAVSFCGNPSRIKRDLAPSSLKKMDGIKGPENVKSAPPEIPLPKIERKEFVLRNFDQFFFTLATVTGVNPKEDAVAKPFIALKNQLPSGNEISLMSPFGELAMMSLAGSFCELSMPDGSKLADKDLSSEAFVEAMLGKFLDSAPSTFSGIQEVRTSLLDIVNSNSLVSMNDKLKLRHVACAAFLSSGFMFIY